MGGNLIRNITVIRDRQVHLGVHTLFDNECHVVLLEIAATTAYVYYRLYEMMLVGTAHAW
jgi:hypothetical protein